MQISKQATAIKRIIALCCAIIVLTLSPAWGMMRVNNLSGFNANKKSGTITFANPANPAISAGSGDTHTFSSVSLGSNGTDRVIVIAVGYSTKSVAAAITSVTVDGNSTTEIEFLQQGSADDRAGCGVYAVSGLSATSGDVVVTLDAAIGTSRGLGIAVYNLLGANATAFASNSAGADSGTSANDVSINTAAGGAAVGAGGSIVGTDHSWVGLTETTEVSNGNTRMSGVGNATASGSTPLTVTATMGASGKQAFCSASFQPA